MYTYKKKIVILQSIGIIVIKNKETRVITYTFRYSGGSMIFSMYNFTVSLLHQRSVVNVICHESGNLKSAGMQGSYLCKPAAVARILQFIVAANNCCY